MRHALRIGRVSEIEVAVHWTVPVVAMLVMYCLYAIVLPSAVAGGSAVAYAGTTGQLMVLLLVALFAHELAHVLVARHYGIAVRRITVWPLGGWSEPASGAPMRTELLVAVAGPAVNLLLSGVSEVAAAAATSIGLPALTVASLKWFSGVNIVLALVNVLPGAPLDGGRVLPAMLRHRPMVHAVACRVGVVVGWAIAAGGLAQVLRGEAVLGLWLVLLGLSTALVADDVTAARSGVRRA